MNWSWMEQWNSTQPTDDITFDHVIRGQIKKDIMHESYDH